MKNSTRLIVLFWVLWALPFPIGKAFGIKTTTLVRDPVAVLDGAFYTGMISNLGILAWCSGMAVAFFAADLIRRRAGDDETVRFLLWTGGLAAIAMIDDLFLVHEKVFPKYLRLPEETVYVAYLVAGVAYLAKFHRLIRERSAYGWFVGTAVLLGLSVLVDVGVLPGGIGVEDLLKYAGIGALAWFCILSARRLVGETEVSRYPAR